MINFLARKYIKDYKNVTNQNVRLAYGYLCSFVGIVLNVLLFLGKFTVGSLSASVSITADAFNNLSDAGSSIIGLIGFKLASQKPDPDHPFGHGRYEYIASLVISAIIIIIAYELGRESIGKIIHPEKVSYSIISLLVLICSIVVKLYMYFYNKKTGELIDSSTMKATSLDSISDAISTSAVLLSAIIAMTFNFYVDGYIGLAVALFIAWSGISSARETIDLLLGTPPDSEFVRQIQDIVMSHEGILGIHDMLVHNYGPGRIFVSLHAEVPSDGNILEIHDTIDNIEKDILLEMGCMVTIHMDPINVSDEETNKAKEMVKEILKDIDENIGFHDFRIVSGPTHTNLIFDILVPHKYKYTDEEIVHMISREIHEQNQEYFSVINVDKDFSNYIQ